MLLAQGLIRRVLGVAKLMGYVGNVNKRIMSLTSKHLLVDCNLFREVDSTFKCHQGMLFVESQQE